MSAPPNALHERLSKATNAELAKFIVALRDKREAIESEAKKKAAEIVETSHVAEAIIEKRMLAEGLVSAKTEHGTVMLQLSETARCGDWAALYAYIQETGRFDLLHKRVATDAARLILNDTKMLPPGVQIDTTRKVIVRRPS